MVECQIRQEPEVLKANIDALKAGYNYGENRRVDARSVPRCQGENRPGTYRKLTGNEALAMGLVAASEMANKPLICASLPHHSGVRYPSPAFGNEKTLG